MGGVEGILVCLSGAIYNLMLLQTYGLVYCILVKENYVNWLLTSNTISDT